MSKEVVIEHSAITDSQTITDVMRDKFKENDLNLHVNEVESLEDDFKTGKRILKVKNTKYHVIGSIPWHKKQPMGT